jgi:hypothetical protein
MLAGECEAVIPKSEEVVLLVVDEDGVSPALPPALLPGLYAEVYL